MKKLFGKKDNNKVTIKQTETQIALGKLEETERIINKSNEVITKKIQAEVNLAIKYKECNDINQAKAALKRKKVLESRLAKNDGLLASIAVQRDTLESSAVNMQVAQAVSMAGKALKADQARFNVDKLDKVVDEFQDEQYKIDEFNQAISRIGNENPATAYVDEDDLMAELNQLSNTSIKSDAQNVQSLPTVPAGAGTKAAPVDLEQDLLAELEQIRLPQAPVTAAQPSTGGATNKRPVAEQAQKDFDTMEQFFGS